MIDDPKRPSADLPLVSEFYEGRAVQVRVAQPGSTTSHFENGTLAGVEYSLDGELVLSIELSTPLKGIDRVYLTLL